MLSRKWGKRKVCWLVLSCSKDPNKTIEELFVNGKPKVFEDSILGYYIPKISEMLNGRVILKNAYYSHFFLRVDTSIFNWREFQELVGHLHFLGYYRSGDIKVPCLFWDEDIEEIKAELGKRSYHKPHFSKDDEIEIIRQDHVLIGQKGKVIDIDGDDVRFTITSPDGRWKFKDCKLKYHEIRKVKDS